VDAACETAVHVAKRIDPIVANVKLMDTQYEEYRKIYPALRTIDHFLSGANQVSRA
jgi:hypothetical protein